MSTPDRRPTVADWRPPTEPPEIPEVKFVPVLIAFWSSGSGEWQVHSGYYMNQWCSVHDSPYDAITGFHMRRDRWDNLGVQDFVRCSLDAWAPMPTPPTSEAIAMGFAAESCDADRIVAELKAIGPDDRLCVFLEFCRHCGNDNPDCQCRNDE